jgi:hypothetical protein
MCSSSFGVWQKALNYSSFSPVFAIIVEPDDENGAHHDRNGERVIIPDHPLSFIVEVSLRFYRTKHSGRDSLALLDQRNSPLKV